MLHDVLIFFLAHDVFILMYLFYGMYMIRGDIMLFVTFVVSSRYAGPLMAHLKQTTLYQHSLWQVTHQWYQLGISYLWDFGPVHILGIDASP